MVAVSESFRAIGTTNRILATDPGVLPQAVAAAQDYLHVLDLAASRFRADSELSRIAAAAATAELTTTVGHVLGGCLRAALDVAAWTDGLVDPTIGAALLAAGYDADIDVVRARADRPSPRAQVPAPGWHLVRYDPDAGVLSIPRGLILDLGATGKAYAADVLADQLVERFGGGFLVDLGGDLAIAGGAPPSGWAVGVEDRLGHTRQVVAVHDACVATSSTQVRTWRSDGASRHHILDPRTGAVAAPVWAQVTCAADTTALANAASTAAIVLGHDAPSWLRERGIPARLERVRESDLATAWQSVETAVVTTCGWPEEARSAA